MSKWVAGFLLVGMGVGPVPLVYSLPLIFCFLWFYSRSNPRDLCYVLVLGDVGHSPRTFNQVSSLIECGNRVVLFGFRGSSLPAVAKEYIARGSLSVVYLSQCSWAFVPSRLARYILKTISQAVSMSVTLFKTAIARGENPRNILVQNPPSIPCLAVCFVAAQLLDSRFVIDWHNYGFSIMAIQKANSAIVKVACFYEKFLAKLSDANLTVTKAMANDISSWGARDVRVLYDKPHSRFSRLDSAEKSEFLERLGAEIPELKKVSHGTPLVVSSTSWTEDEDFSILLDAVAESDAKGQQMVLAITGKGPQKEFYLGEIKRRNLQNISIVTPWLQVDDYPKLLGCADLGVSLHSSSSGLDLPMKVVDMFGAGLPVLALKFRALPELVQDGKNGRVFANADELAKLIASSLDVANDDIDEWRRFILESRESWSDHWSAVAKPVFE